MERSKKIKETQYLWRFEKEGMLLTDKERYGPLVEVMDPLFESGIVTYDEWVDHLSEVFKKHCLNYPEDTLENRGKIIDATFSEIVEHYKQFNKQ